MKSLQELQVSIEAKYIDQLEGEENNERSKDRETDIKDCPKTILRNECIKMLLAVTALATPILNPDAGDQHQSKSRQIYWRLLDIVYKIDCIDG